MTRDEPLKLQLPGPAEDRPRLARVGIVAAVGFVLGIVWPWLAGVQLVPKAPTEHTPASLSSSKPPPAASARPSPAAPPAKPDPETEEGPLADRIKVGQPSITSCRDAKGNQIDKCDEIKFDDVAQARLKALAGCGDAEGAHGMLSVGFDLDFQKNKVVRVRRGVSTTLPDGITEALLKCTRKEFLAASLTGIEHKHAGYTIYYLAEFLPPGKKASEEEAETKGDETTPASGMATVTWNVAIIRESPTTDSARVARILSGTRVAVVGRRNNWYKVKYDAKGSEGWVYKSAIGL